MPAVAHRRETPAPSASAETEAPSWSTPIAGSGSNAEVASLIAGTSVEATEADSIFSATPAPQVDAEETPAWAEDESAPEVADAAPERRFAEDAAAPAPPPSPTPRGTLGPVHTRHARELPRMKSTLSRTQRHELERFRDNWAKNRGRYQAVASKTGVPAMLIAALHYRESSMNFNTYLHQGDPLGRPARNHPRNIPIFHKWEDAAVHALNSKKGVANAVGLTEDSTDATAMATYAEAYNGLGYHNRGLASPYVYAGSDRYRGGRYVADGKFDPRSFDRRLGTATILQEMGGAQTPAAGATGSGGPTAGPTARPGGPSSAPGGGGWEAVLSGDRPLQRGDRGPAVRELQSRLAKLGYDVSVDGDFGPGTNTAVRTFQKDRGLTVDGVVGAATAGALEKGGAPARSPRDLAWSAVLEGRTILKLGSQGDAVLALQERLRAQGYGIGKDGRFGPATRAAVYDLQTKSRLAVDGEVGPSTAAALDQAVGR